LVPDIYNTYRSKKGKFKPCLDKSRNRKIHVRIKVPMAGIIS
jgi:hypothetical protein